MTRRFSIGSTGFFNCATEDWIVTAMSALLMVALVSDDHQATDCPGVVLNAAGNYGPNARVFGHSGWGGSFVCADPERGIGTGYVHNQMGPDVGGDPRRIFICRAVHDCLWSMIRKSGYRFSGRDHAPGKRWSGTLQVVSGR